ncbi:MAG: HAMP domain-containing sensor histidine kinase [Acidocella sp.]|nr:HAMP domain-containing sensor histidine kinase [Acidocella sp.]
MPGTGSFFRRRIRPYLVPRSLSARVLWLTVEIILLVEIVILMPSLGRERETWLWDRVTDAHLAAYSEATEAQAIKGGMLDPATQRYLLKLSDTEAIRLLQAGSITTLMPANADLQISSTINLDKENILNSMWHADLAVLGLETGNELVEAVSPLDKTMQVQVVIDGATLASHLRIYVGHIAMLSVVIALVTGLLVFAALDRRLVRPMRILTASIVGFREDPARGGSANLKWLSGRPNDEVAEAARELAAMQDELRAALWRNARLAAVGTAVAKISHDLRNILTSALLVADRLQETADPVVKQAANTLITAVERAAELVSRTVDFAREGPPTITVSPVVLRDLADEAASAVRSSHPYVVIDNLVPGSLILPIDRTQIYRVLVNLLRNAAEATASRITLSIQAENGSIRLAVADNGPGLPKKVQERLFQPFTGTGRRGGTGLGLAIARDLIRAHGGDLTLRSTGPEGTVFVMGLAVTEEPVN